MKRKSQIYHWDEIVPDVNPSAPEVQRLPRFSSRFDYPLPYGAIPDEGGVHFYIFSRSAREVRILFYNSVADTQPSEIYPLYPDTNRWGDIWSIYLNGKRPGDLYHIQADGPFEPERGQRFDRNARLLDPYARALSGDYLFTEDGILVPPKCVVVRDQYDWQGDRHLRYTLADSIIYEVHVRGLTASPSGGCAHPGTYLGLIEKIPYLKSLGISAIELMPVFEFLERDPNAGRGGNPRENYWGYDPIAFFAPHQGYAYDKTPGAQVREFKQMVHAMHRAGIEVILDVVFNHTAEGNERGPTISFKGLENSVYYMLENDPQHYRNYSGCGNTVNGNHPIVRELIFNSLRYWVHNYHIDGFRFDLASILSRDRNGNLVHNPPVIETIAEDPMLADTKIIAEAWDAAGAYQVGTFSSIRWAEWNGKYRDDVRRYWRGDDFMTNLLATRISGSSDLYKPGGRAPYHSINFITSHDGYTLNDLVSYERKHNEANGEGNHDGDNHGFSCNFGVEGPSDDPAIRQLRSRQIRNMLATLLLSQGVPMILMGDECRRTQGGNNNAYCQNNAISWFDWDLAKKNAHLGRFVRSLADFRRAEPTLRRQSFLSGLPACEHTSFADVSWYRADGAPFNWSDWSACTLVSMLAALPPHLECFSRSQLERRPERRDIGTPFENMSSIEQIPQPHHPPLSRFEGEFRRSHHLLFVFHNGKKPGQFSFPSQLRDLQWRTFVDTSAESPYDIYPDLDGPLADTGAKLILEPLSFYCFVAPCEK